MIGTSLSRSDVVAAGLTFALAGLIAVTMPQPAHTSDWACQVVLCLTASGSSTTYAECVPPITELWGVFAIGGFFTTCTAMVSRSKSVSRGDHLSLTWPDGATFRSAPDLRTRAATQQ